MTTILICLQYPLRLGKIVFFNLHHFSVRLQEDNITIFDKLTTRIEHITGLKANTSQYGAEPMLVSYYKFYSNKEFYDIKSEIIQNSDLYYYLQIVRQLWNRRRIQQSHG